MSKLVRVKPYAPKRGQLVRRIVFRGNLYRGDRGWYEVDDATAADLAKLHQPASSLYNGPRQEIFDVTDNAGAKALERTEEQPARADPDRPVRVSRSNLSTEDLSPEKPAAQTTRQAKKPAKPATTKKPRKSRR